MLVLCTPFRARAQAADMAAALDRFDSVQSWVREWRTPMDPMGLPPAHSAAVTLRYEGAIVGRGVAITQTGDPVPGIHVLAASRAISEAKERMPVPRDALFEESLAAAAPLVAVTVEVGGAPAPIELKDFAEAINEVAPGLDGIAVRIGDRVEAMFPESMLAAGMDAAAGYRALVSKASDDPTLALKSAADLRAQGVVFYRFASACAGQPGAGKPAMPLVRGGRRVSLAELNMPGLRAWSEAVASHLIHAARRGGGGAGTALGTLNPVTGAREAGGSPAMEAALTAAALAKFAKVYPSSVRTEDAAAVAASYVAALAPRQPADPDLAMWSLVTIAARHSGAAAPPLPTALTKAIGTDDPTAAIPRGSLGIVALGLALQDPAAMSRADQRKFITRAMVRTPANELVREMPWLGWAACRAWTDDAGKAEEMPAAAALREMRAQVWAHQLRGESLSAESADLTGGIVFTLSRQPLPTWHGARPVGFIATMLRDARLTDDKELQAETIRLLEALRYLRQLTADEAECHMYKDRAAAIGGVRGSVFDQRMSAEAAAVTLLAVCEAIESLEAISARGAAPK